MARKSLSKKIRFEVFKRDSFTCQYCGRKAPDVLLNADHIQPTSKGGTNDLLNLTTSCEDCNSGKSDRELSDSPVIDKQRAQLEALQERKEQIELMFEWQKGLLDLEDHVSDQIADYWVEKAQGFSLNEQGFQSLKKLLNNFEISEAVLKLSISRFWRAFSCSWTGRSSIPNGLFSPRSLAPACVT
ncbi:MAG: HNH endonuclease, partial [Luteolibacter sp.]|uniref:HNH endonuclease n=1 Tax=Luteolibacter sp. TaxID=1962973 RepID=UPI0032637578